MENKKPTLQKNTLIKNAQANAESIFFKRVFFSPPKKKFKLFFPSLLKKLKHPTPKPTMQPADTYQRDNWTTEREAHAHNSGFKKLAVQWLIETLCFVSSSVVADSLVLRNPPLLKPPKRYKQGNNKTNEIEPRKHKVLRLQFS